MTARLIIGDARKVIDTLPAGSVDLVITSSPYFWKRAYLPGDHPDKALEVGQEATPGDFLAACLDVMDGLPRVLAPYGSVFWDLGDSASGSGGAGGDYRDGGRRAGQPTYDSHRHQRHVARTNRRRDRAQDVAAGLIPPVNNTRRRRPGWPESKSVCWLPQLFGASLAYGRNLLTGEPCQEWTTRPPITWCKEKPSVGELIDTVRVATELVVHAVRDRRYFFDLDALRQPRDYRPGRVKSSSYVGHPRHKSSDVHPDQACNPLGAPPLDWWVIPTANYNGSHYAVMPDELVAPLVTAAAPERVCTVCAQPWERMVRCRACGAAGGNSYRRTFRATCTCSKEDPRPWVRTSDWWRPCNHETWRPGVVLDPFAGTGTTLAVATGHGRDAIGIDLDARNLALVRERVGMFLAEAELR